MSRASVKDDCEFPIAMRETDPSSKHSSGDEQSRFVFGLATNIGPTRKGSAALPRDAQRMGLRRQRSVSSRGNRTYQAVPHSPSYKRVGEPRARARARGLLGKVGASMPDVKSTNPNPTHTGGSPPAVLMALRIGGNKLASLMAISRPD